MCYSRLFWSLFYAGYFEHQEKHTTWTKPVPFYVKTAQPDRPTNALYQIRIWRRKKWRPVLQITDSSYRGKGRDGTQREIHQWQPSTQRSSWRNVERQTIGDSSNINHVISDMWLRVTWRTFTETRWYRNYVAPFCTRWWRNVSWSRLLRQNWLIY